MAGRIAKLSKIIAGAALPLIILACSEHPSTTMSETDKELDSELVRAWHDALRNGSKEQSIDCARQIIGQHPKQTLTSSLKKLLTDEGLTADIVISQDFDELDFRLWYDAWFLGHLAKEIVTRNNSVTDPLPAILDAVKKQLKNEEKPFGPLPWPAFIWVRRYGLCDRQAWLFAEMTYQLGYEPIIVYLTDPETGDSAHTICEIRSKSGEVWTVDVLSGKMLPGVSVEMLAENTILAKKFWPEKELWRKQLVGAMYWLPVYPQDFASGNQKLAELIKPLSTNIYPRFGENPETRLERARQYSPNGKVDFWFFPFRVLKEELNTKTGQLTGAE